MTGPSLDANLVGFAKSNKDIEFGWARGGDEEQLLQRLTDNLRQIDAQLQNQFAHNPRESFQLRYAFFGGVVDAGASWEVILDGSILLPDDATSFVERTPGGTVVSNTTEFTYPDNVPMAEARTSNGEIVDVLDRRPELGAATGAGAGVITFADIVGQILPGQVPLAVVKQWESFLSIDFTQLTGVATRAQLPPEIAYEDEPNTFLLKQTIPVLEAVNFEALLRFIGNSSR